MPENGLLDGTKAQLWLPYDAELRGFSFAGAAPVQPTNPTGRNFASYLDLRNGFVLVQFHFIFDANTTFGSGEDIMAFRLPKPGNRSSGHADLVNGTAQMWQGSAASPQLCMALRPSLMDPMLVGLASGAQGFEDEWVQFFVPNLLAMGTVTFAGGNATTATITHGIGSVPSAFDFRAELTNNPSTNPGLWWPTSITSSQLTLNIKNGSTTTPAQFSWKIRQEPNGGATLDVLANRTRPWLWASGHELSGTLLYEARV